MHKIEDIKTCQGLLLDIAKEFHRVCVENDIPYYMLYGSFLGAIRHNGFIPWDDDMDFGVERKYIPKLIEAFGNSLGNDYKLRSIYNSECIIDEPFKLENVNTRIVEPEREHINERLGVNIDIFPLDVTNSCKRLLSRNGIAIYLIKMNSLRFINLNALNWKYKCIAIISKILLLPLSKINFFKFVNIFVLNQKGDCLSNLHGYGLLDIIPKSVLGKPTKYNFENTAFYGPEKADEYLKLIYGDWKVLPPKEKQRVHLAEAYIL